MKTNSYPCFTHRHGHYPNLEGFPKSWAAGSLLPKQQFKRWRGCSPTQPLHLGGGTPRGYWRGKRAGQVWEQVSISLSQEHGPGGSFSLSPPQAVRAEPAEGGLPHGLFRVEFMPVGSAAQKQPLLLPAR